MHKTRIRERGSWSCEIPGVVFYEPDGGAIWVAALEIADGVVVAVRSILNPDKLGPVAGR